MMNCNELPPLSALLLESAALGGDRSRDYGRAATELHRVGPFAEPPAVRHPGHSNSAYQLMQSTQADMLIWGPPAAFVWG